MHDDELEWVGKDLGLVESELQMERFVNGMHVRRGGMRWDGICWDGFVTIQGCPRMGWDRVRDGWCILRMRRRWVSMGWE